MEKEIKSIKSDKIKPFIFILTFGHLLKTNFNSENVFDVEKKINSDIVMALLASRSSSQA